MSAAEQLLCNAFPWGAHVTVEAGSSFLSLRYQVLDEDFSVDSAVLRFERDPGDTLQSVRQSELELAAATGELRLESGAIVRQPVIDDLELLADPFRDFVGPQVDGETGWIARMRLHQSWWRTFRLRVPFGTGPRAGARRRYGNMLDEDGDVEGLNFLTAEARNAYEVRLTSTTAGVEPFRTRRHLMASQTLAFNLFGHLSFHLDLASAAFSSVLGDNVVVHSIEVERLSDALGDRTAFDAFATVTTSSGPACFAIETKLTEPFSQQTYDWAKYAARDLYDSSRWVTGDLEQLGDRRWSQLWRNHMLGLAESSRHALGDVYVFVVHHPLDPHCEANVEGYRSLVTVPDQVASLPLDRLVEAIVDVAGEDVETRQWLEDFQDRYLRLELSGPLHRLPR